MPRGGYQKPSNPAGASGPGKFSKRTDGQKISAPDIDKQDIAYGERSMLEDAQRAAPAKGAAGASIPVRSGGERRLAGTALGGSLPPWLTQTDDPHPDEPTTAGLAAGPGPGPEILDASTPPDDIREIVLEYLSSTFGNEDIRDMLNQMRNERQARVQTPATPSAPMADPISALAKDPLPAPAASPTPAQGEAPAE
jgi:hypothetical protein